MQMKRRTFLTLSLGAGLGWRAGRRALAAPAAAAAAGQVAKADLPTPALLVDLDLFEANLRRLAAHCRQAGCGFRPHAKTHKCPEIARRQVAAGALGVCVATVAEAEAMAGAGLRGVLLTSPMVERGKIARMVELAAGGSGVLLAVGHALQVEALNDAARRRGVTVEVLLDVDVGDRRTGVLPGQPALALAQAIGKARHLRLRGVQAYAGHASHVSGFARREQVSRAALAPAAETRELLRKEGFDAGIFSGGSTGTYNIDPGLGLTELQAGSFIFMDANYRAIGSRSGAAVYGDFAPSLTVLTTVVSATHADQVTVDAGIKAFSTDTPEKPEPKGRAGLTYKRTGDEFGAVTAAPGATLPRIGERLEFIVPHCDPTVNLYDRLYALRGEKVEAVWPITARRETPKGGG
jgi:D-serine deaminase-like pyridoxal phosphate-dependent protein